MKKKIGQEYELSFLTGVNLALSQIWSVLSDPGSLPNFAAYLHDVLQPNLARIYPIPSELRY